MKPLKHVRVVLGADPEADLRAVETSLARGGATIERLATTEQLRQAVIEERADVVLVHVCGHSQALTELMNHPDELKQWPPVIVLTCTEETYLPAMRAGVFDCLVLPVDEAELQRIVSLALESRQVDLPVPMQP